MVDGFRAERELSVDFRTTIVLNNRSIARALLLVNVLHVVSTGDEIGLDAHSPIRALVVLVGRCVIDGVGTFVRAVVVVFVGDRVDQYRFVEHCIRFGSLDRGHVSP